MIREYSDYSVEIEDQKFTTEDGRIYPKTAVVTLFAHNKKEAGRELFGVIDTATVYKMINDCVPIVLDNLYLNDFSLSNYRRLYDLGKKSPVLIASLSAKNSFFDSDICNDFSYAEFSDGEISFEGTNFAKGRTSFTGSKFGIGNVIFSNTYFANGNIEFDGCSFGEGDFLFKNSVIGNGQKDFKDIQFGEGEVSFANTEFNYGEVLFINTRFNSGRFNFKFARITGGKIDFHYSVFGNCEIIFERTEFGNSRVDFRTVDFGTGRVNFNRSVFGNGEISFEGASGSMVKFQFRKAEMGSGRKCFNLMEMEKTELSFEKTIFGSGDITFLESKFRSLSLRSCHLDQYIDLRLSYTSILDISDTVVRDIVDLEPFDFPVRIEYLDISGMRLIGKLYLDWERNNVSRIIADQEGSTLKQKAEQFRILKENFSETGKYSDEDKAYVMFKRYEAKSWITGQKEKGGFTGFVSYLPYWFQWLVFDAMGLYATNPVRVLISMATVYFVFSLIYILMITFTSADIISSTADQLGVAARSFYHSAITFFTIGYGDHFPVKAARVVSSIEGFMGVFLMSYFTVAFVRKVLR
ncbi:MAG: potassium channel family protein [Bacteroidales bacterium]|jgi:hypothetical protein|nr:potassium channel family protein [Bacteroidales bacterium]